MQLEESSNLVKLSLWIYFGQEYYTFRLIRWLHTYNLTLKNSKYGLQPIYIYTYEKKEEEKTYINFNSKAKAKDLKQ